MSASNMFRNATDFDTFTAGQAIFAQGETGNVMYAIRDGEVEIHIGDDVLETLGPGEIFGEMALIDTHTRSAAARAKTACEIIPIDERRFTFLVQQTPMFALQVMKVLAQRIRRNTPTT
ncbi:MAG: cyclic nucleotide-binding domain-containing protein [Planctomycetota bacterium]